MDIRFFKVLSIVLGSLFFLSMIFLVLFGLRLAKLNGIKSQELQSAVTKREKEIVKACQLDKEKKTTTYTADEVFGGFQFTYPKAWATNVKRVGSSPQLQYLADPDLIVMNTEKGPDTALRVAVYSDQMVPMYKRYEGISIGNSPAYRITDVTLSGLKGKRLEGADPKTPSKIIAFVLLPLRDKTLYIGTDNYSEFKDQFESILQSFKISK